MINYPNNKAIIKTYDTKVLNKKSNTVTTFTHQWFCKYITTELLMDQGYNSDSNNKKKLSVVQVNASQHANGANINHKLFCNYIRTFLQTLKYEDNQT